LIQDEKYNPSITFKKSQLEILSRGKYRPILLYFQAKNFSHYKNKPDELAKYCIDQLQLDIHVVSNLFYLLLQNYENSGASLTKLSSLAIEFSLIDDFSDFLFEKSKSMRISRTNIPEQNQTIEVNTSLIKKKENKLRFTQFFLDIYKRHLTADKKPKISFITSVFKGEIWINDFLENITTCKLFEQCELILVNANSPENETKSINKYLGSHKNIFYIKLDFDPGLYNVWNLAIDFSNADNLSNANLDDRKSKNFIEEHLKALAFNVNSKVVSAPCYISEIPNISFEDLEELGKTQNLLFFYDSPNTYGFNDFFVKYFNPKNNADSVVVRNIPHCMPVWRKELHFKYGYFDESRGGPTADFEFWIRCASNGETFFNINKPLGVYYFSNTTTYSAKNKSSINSVIDHYIN